MKKTSSLTAVITTIILACGLAVAFPAAAGAAGVCVNKGYPTDSPKDHDCGPYNAYPRIRGTSGDITVANDIWSEPARPWSQTLYATSPGNWHVTARFPADTSVHSFPNTGQTQDWLPGTERPAALSSWKSMVSRYSVTLSRAPGVVAEAGYDLWLDNWDYEVMIQAAFTGDKARPRCDVNGDVIARHTFYGQAWNLCKFDHEIIWQPRTGVNRPSGTVHVKGMLRWLVQHHYLPARNTLTAISFGFEICGTSGRAATFAVHRFSFIARH